MKLAHVDLFLHAVAVTRSHGHLLGRGPFHISGLQWEVHRAHARFYTNPPHAVCINVCAGARQCVRPQRAGRAVLLRLHHPQPPQRCAQHEEAVPRYDSEGGCMQWFRGWPHTLAVHVVLLV